VRSGRRWTGVIPSVERRNSILEKNHRKFWNIISILHRLYRAWPRYFDHVALALRIALIFYTCLLLYDLVVINQSYLILYTAVILYFLLDITSI